MCSFSFQTNEDETETRCYICQKSNTAGDILRQFEDMTLMTLKNVASLRKNIKSDIYCEVTQRILLCTDERHKNYTAVKRPRENKLFDEPTMHTNTKTMNCSDSPMSDQQVIFLKGYCIFCGKSCRRRIRKKNQD